MQVANRTTRRYITPTSTKNSAGNLRPIAKKHSSVPSASHSSPKKVVDTQASKANDPPTLKKLIDRFRYDEPQPRPERESVSSDFWWLRDELQNTCNMVEDEGDETRSNIPEFIEIFPSTDIDQDLNKRASLLLNQTFSAHSSDIGNVSSTGIGSTSSTTMTTTTTSTFQPVAHEQPARPIFTRFTESKFDLKSDTGDDDILYQWRLRRRLEQAQHGEPITFPTRVTNRTHAPPVRALVPSMPIEIPTVLSLPPPPPPPLGQPSSPKRERQQSSTTNTESEHIKQPISTTPIPIRQYSEVATQTLQDACIQTSPMAENRFSSTNLIPDEVDLRPTRDDDHQASVWHRPPPRSKCEITQVSSSPSPIKRHHHHHHHHSFRPVVVAGQPTINSSSSSSHHQRSIVYPSTTLQSSQDSTLTHVTSIMINDNHYPIRSNNHNDIIDESHCQYQQQQDNGDDYIDYANDEILNILTQKRDELLRTFREIEQRLTDMNL